MYLLQYRISKDYQVHPVFKVRSIIKLSMLVNISLSFVNNTKLLSPGFIITLYKAKFFFFPCANLKLMENEKKEKKINLHVFYTV